MKNLFTLKYLLLAGLLIGSLRGWGQTNNYFGTTGTINGNVWSTNPLGPYTSALVTTGGPILNFNTAGIATGASIPTVVGINFGAALIWTVGGTLGSAGINLPINVSPGIEQNLGSQSFSTSATFAITKNGTGGFLTLGGSFGGGFTLNSGTLIAGGINALGNGTLTINGGIISGSGNRDFTGKLTGITIGGDFTLGATTGLSSSTANLTFNAPMALGSGITRIITLGGTGNYTFIGTISGSGSGLTITTTSFGTLSLAGTNSYTGPTTINGGTLSTATINNGGSAGNIGAASFSASNLVLGGGTLLYTGAGETTDRNFTLTNATTSTINSINTLTLTGAAASSTGSLVKAGAGTLVLSGSNQYTGGTTINDGTLQITASERINDASALSIAGGAGGGKFDLNGHNETVGSLSGAGTITSSAIGTSVLSVGGDNSSTTFSGIVQNGSGTVSITKQGTGILTLSGNNTYTGTTTINAGTIQSNSASALFATNSVNVNNTGTLQISQNQTLANVTLAAGSTLTVDANKTLTITGTLTVNTGAIITGTIAYSGSGALVYNGSGSLTAGSEWPTSMVPASVSINAGATIVLTATRTTTPTLNIDGTLDAATYSITGNGTVNINGTLMTENSNGFVGTGATFTGTTIVITLGLNSIINYAASGDQAVQGATAPTYVNVIFSGSGTKTLASNNVVSAKITVSGSAIFDAGNHVFGGIGTTLDMTGTSTYRTAGTGTKPDPTGTYSLGANTTIDFSNTFATEEIISSAHTYANILVSGSSVADTKDIFGPSTITIQSGGNFNVTGTFNVHNVNGFSGAANSAINNVNNPTINLVPGSTIQYNRNDVTGQTITNQVPYQNLTISGTGDKTAPAGILIIDGNFSKTAATFVHNNGTVLFDGGATAQSYTSNSEILFNNITNNNLNTFTGLSVNDSMAILNQLTLNDNSKLNINGNITLNSSATSTANVATIPSTAFISYGTGAFTVERYIPALRAWRFLSVPVNSTQTIHAAWQEGKAPNSTTPVGFGTQITSNRPTWVADSFDVYSAGGPSMKTYNPATDSYEGIASTHMPFDPSLGGYMTFIRGDRTVNTFPGIPTETVLRIQGKLFTGDQPMITVPPDQFMPVNNPYASRLQLSKLNKSGEFFFVVWDPNLGGATSAYGLGAFQTLTYNSTNHNYDVVPGGGSYGTTADYLESGQAFFAYYLTGGDLTVQENAKAGGSSVVFSPNQFPVPNPQLRTNLYTVNNDGSVSLADGILNGFSDSYSNDIDGLDAAKKFNTGENLSVKIGGKLLAIERRHTVTQSDTIFLNLSGLQAQDYRFEITATDLNLNGNTLTGFLEDNYLHTKTALNLNTATTINFTVNSGEASSASNRFRIVLNAPDAGPLPVTITNVKAYTQNSAVAVEWKVSNEAGILQYEIEHSSNANTFVKSGIVAAKNMANSSYKWLDENAVPGYNYYRIRIIDFDGKIKYTSVVKVFVEKATPAITIYPNPIKNGIISLQLINQPAGQYNIRLLNKMGQVIVSRQINHAEGSSIESIKLNYHLAHGIYQLGVIQPDGNKKNLSLVY